MASPFEQATRAAIREILDDQLHESKHGYILTKDGYEATISALYQFLLVSRQFKEAGTRMMGQMSPGSSR